MPLEQCMVLLESFNYFVRVHLISVAQTFVCDQPRILPNFSQTEVCATNGCFKKQCLAFTIDRDELATQSDS